MSTVVGIFGDVDGLKSLVDGLSAQGADLGNLHVLWTEELPTELASSGVRFIWIGDVEVERGPRGLVTGGYGTGVPGLSDPDEGELEEIEEDPVLEELAELSIPDGRTDDYARALEDGRIVAGYRSAANAESTRSVFSSCGGNPVEVF